MTTCRWTATDQPRHLVGHHTDDCDRDSCPGWQPCTRSHCVGDACRGRNHADTICAECITAARDDLAAIVDMADFQLLEEVLYRGSVTGEAAMMLGPAANPDAWRYRATSALVGRIDAAYLDDCRDELHPLFVLGTWENIWRDALDQQSDLRQTVRRASDYLAVQMHVMAGRTDPPFDEFAQELRQCRAHLEDVLSDGHRDERSRVFCIDCPGARLVKVYGRRAIDDHWVCRRCRRAYYGHDFLVAQHHHLASEGAERFVRLQHALKATPRSEHTVRTWLRRLEIRAYCDVATHQVWVWWPDVRRLHLEKQAREPRQRSA